MEIIDVNGYKYEVNSYGMLKQLNPKKFDYSKAYLDKQSTTRNMSWLRIGYLLGVVSFDYLTKATVLELGPGSGMFFDTLKPHVANIEGHDVAKSEYSTVSLEYIQSNKWDLLCAFDVLEHFEEIDDLWKIDFEYGYFSMPCPPANGINNWRHLKPNEHIWHIPSESFKKWANDHKYEVLLNGQPEDLIRRRWDQKKANINSFIIKKHEYCR